MVASETKTWYIFVVRSGENWRMNAVNAPCLECARLSNFNNILSQRQFKNNNCFVKKCTRIKSPCTV